MEKYSFFYADDGLVESTNAVLFQWSFDVMTGIFEWVGRQTIVVKTDAMIGIE